MPVDIVEHLLAGMKQRVQGTDALVGYNDTTKAVDVWMDTQRTKQPLDIDATVGNITGARITRQVIEFIDIERAAQQVAQQFIIGR